MKKDAWNWNACPDLPAVMLMSNHEITRAIHKEMVIDYSRQSTEHANKNDIVKFGHLQRPGNGCSVIGWHEDRGKVRPGRYFRHGKGACYGHCQEDGRQ